MLPDNSRKRRTVTTEFTSPGALAESTISILPFDGSVARWNRFVAERPEASFCHRGEWREIMTDVLGNECVYRVAVDGSGRWLGVLPLVRVRSLIFGHYLISMPFLNYGGPIGAPQAQARLSRAAVAEARRSHADHVELRPRHQVPREVSHEVSGKLEETDRKVTVLLTLPDSADALWTDGFRSKLRSQIRRPMKEEMETRFGADQLFTFYEIFSAKMRDLGTPVLPFSFFERCAEVFGDRVEIGAVYHDDRAVAAGFGFFWRDEFEMTWAASRPEADRLSPNMLLYWSFMRHAIERGAGAFNFGRCTPDGGTHRFKKQWGGDDVPLPWLHWSASPEAGTAEPDGPMVRMAVSAWQRMPLFLANRAGPLLARNLPF